MLTLAILIVMPRLTKRVPAPLVALVAGTLAATAINHLWPDHAVATIGSRFSYEVDGCGIPPHTRGEMARWTGARPRC